MLPMIGHSAGAVYIERPGASFACLEQARAGPARAMAMGTERAVAEFQAIPRTYRLEGMGR